MSDLQMNELLSRVEKLEKSKRFWKRLALAQLAGVVLLLAVLIGSSLYMTVLARQQRDQALQAQMVAEEHFRQADEAQRKAQDAEQKHRKSVEDLGGKHPDVPKEK